MKEKIERYARGSFEFDRPNLCLSEEEIRITVEAGKTYQGSFTVSNSAGRRMKGKVFSSNRLMKIEHDTLSEAVNTISYQFQADCLKAGEEIHGQVVIVSDCGEASIPFSIKTETSYYLTTMGKIKDLFQFTNLARMDWSDAKKIFRSEDFAHIFLEDDNRNRFVYRNLIKSISTSQALEEFLVSIRKKAVIRLDIDKTQLEYKISREPVMDKLTLTKNHWGYTEIRVSTDVPFVQLEQKFLWADRFIGNTHQIVFTIDPRFLSKGNNYGHIWIKTAYQTIAVSILCKYNQEKRKVNGEGYDNIKYQLTQNYLDFRLNKIDLNKYIGGAKALMNKLPGPEVNNLKDLVRTHLAIISGKNKIVEELLADFAQGEAILRKRSVLEYCCYLYLNALYRKDEELTRKAAETIRYYYVNGNSDWRILWFLLYTDKRYEKNKGLKLADIKEQFEAGCHSPILYYEAVCILNEEPYLLRELLDFELQVLNFGIKYSLLSKEIIRQFTYLSGKIKSFHPLVFSGLTTLYKKYEATDQLAAICSTLIKGLKKSEKYFEWYRLGIEAQLRITELYEYYMSSINSSSQEPLPQSIVLYFVYNSSLSDKKKAFLYANIIKYKDKQEPIYRSYYKRMELYAAKMLEGHLINEDLAVIYKEFLAGSLTGPEISKHLPYVMYRHELTCSNPNMSHVVVIHQEMDGEEIIPIVDGKTQFNVYTNNVLLLFTDSFGNRYVDTVEYTLKPYLNAEEYESRCIKYSDHPMLLLHLFSRYQSYRIMNELSIAVRKKVLQIEGLSREHYTLCVQTLIEHYYENYHDENLEYYLRLLDLKPVRPAERIKYIEFMVIRAFYDKALEAMEQYGYEKIMINRLVKLCSGWLQQPAAELKHDFMLSLCYYVFSQGKYDEAILTYLVKYYSGSIGELMGIWKAAKGFELDCLRLEERILAHMIYTGDCLEESFSVFSSYYQNASNSMLVRAYLSYCAYQFLVHERAIEQDLFTIMKRELFYEENTTCLLAWLKYKASADKLSDSDLLFVEFNIQNLVKKGIILPFYLEYSKKAVLPERILDKCYITYLAAPEKRVFIHYRISNQGEKDFITERMPDVFSGIHVKEFILFYQEEIEYYISEESDDEIKQTDRKFISYTDSSTAADESNYNLINRMLMALEHDRDELYDMMEDYAKKEFMIDTCFKHL